MLGDEAVPFAASRDAAHPVLAVQQGVVFAAGEIGSFHGGCPRAMGGRLKIRNNGRIALGVSRLFTSAPADG